MDTQVSVKVFLIEQALDLGIPPDYLNNLEDQERENYYSSNKRGKPTYCSLEVCLFLKHHPDVIPI